MSVMSVSQRLLLAFVAFVFVMFFTPGPNNIMLMSSGLTYGFRVTWALFGSVLRPVGSSGRSVRFFNIVMASLLLGSLYPVLMDH